MIISSLGMPCNFLLWLDGNLNKNWQIKLFLIVWLTQKQITLDKELEEMMVKMKQM